jgi:hypothetical protein
VEILVDRYQAHKKISTLFVEAYIFSALYNAQPKFPRYFW